MFACLTLGDSTAVASASAINARYALRSDVQAVERMTTARILRWSRPAKAYGTGDYAIDSDDQAAPSLVRQLTEIRLGFCRKRIIWLLSYGRSRHSTVDAVAARYGDEMLDLARFRFYDRVRPA